MKNRGWVMGGWKRPLALRFSWSLLAVAGTFLFTWMAWPLLQHMPFAPVFILFPVALWRWGAVPALVSCTALAFSIQHHFVRPSYESTAASILVRTVLLGIFAVTAIVLKTAHDKEHRIRKELEQAVRARDAFLSIASHELKTPLTSAQLQLEVVFQFVMKKASHEDIRKKLHVLKKQLTRLETLVKELLDVTRFAGGKLELHKEHCNLAEIVEEAVQRATAWGLEWGCNIQLRLESEVGGYWDKSRIDQVVTNILSNACKYGRGKPVEITVSKNDRFAIVAIRDHGPGISPEDQIRIFEKFERLAGTAKHVQGLGLGLWIAKTIVERHHGTIQVDSKPGEGTTFVVSLPR